MEITRKRSLINEYFTKEMYIELMKITMLPDLDNNEKGTLVKKYLKDCGVPFDGLGPGTNRMGISIDGYAVKIALDKDGMIDNRREMLYTKALQPYVVRVYECVPNGLILVCEMVEIFAYADFLKYQDLMREMLAEISKNFLIGDCGITGKNYINWGIRRNGTICILDFAYIYSVKYNVFTCTCSDTAILRYDSNYVNLICPECGKKYTFGELRRKITRKQQEDEIGDIRRLGYNLTEPLQEVEVVPEFEPKPETKKKKKEKTEEDKQKEKERKRLFKILSR